MRDVNERRRKIKRLIYEGGKWVKTDENSGERERERERERYGEREGTSRRKGTESGKKLFS